MEGTGSNHVDSPHSTVVIRPKHGNVSISGLLSYKLLVGLIFGQYCPALADI